MSLKSTASNTRSDNTHWCACTIHTKQWQTITRCHSPTYINEHRVTANTGVLSQTAGVQNAWTVLWVCSCRGNIDGEVQRGGGRNVRQSISTFSRVILETRNWQVTRMSSEKFTFYLWYFVRSAFELDPSEI